ncbi:MAG: succinate dehydrogenase assembly factor 2 [Alphaproteobacteria bacterium]|jgi:antitoxin CptB|nr:succinate dehydrogenase assembly factor 2 [Alphaproteobacteria bacterium]
MYVSKMQTIIPDNLKPLYVRAKRRGLIELDILLGYVADKYLLSMSAEQVERFRILLLQEDSNIFKWIMDKEPVPKEFDNDIWEMVKSFDSSDKKAMM